MPKFKVRHLLEGKRLLEGRAYFNVDTQRCGAYWRKYGVRMKPFWNLSQTLFNVIGLPIDILYLILSFLSNPAIHSEQLYLVLMSNFLKCPRKSFDTVTVLYIYCLCRKISNILPTVRLHLRLMSRYIMEI